MTAPVIVWLRRDLRLADQAAFAAAVASGAPVIPVYILDDDTPKHRKMGAASRWWALGSRLILRAGKSHEVLRALAEEIGASAMHCMRHYEPWWRNAEKAVASGLSTGCAFVGHDGNYLLPAGSVTTGSGGQYKIYTPFMRALWQHMPPPVPLAAPTQCTAPQTWPESDNIDDYVDPG
ncbi:MAG: hypothetical protein RLZZ604_395 [Pseudomonadota bacterium]